MFEQIGEGHKIMHEGPKKEIDLDELERLAERQYPQHWYIKEDDPWHEIILTDGFGRCHDRCIAQCYLERDARYITAACNALPGLIAENRELRARVQELERQREWLAKFVASYVDCNQCPYSEDVCTPQAHVDCCSLISQKAKEAGE